MDEQELRPEIRDQKSGQKSRNILVIYGLDGLLLRQQPPLQLVTHHFAVVTFCIEVASSSKIHSMIETGMLPFLIRSS